MIKKSSTSLWIDGVFDLIVQNEYFELSGKSKITDIADYEEKTSSIRERLKPYRSKDHGAMQALIKCAFDTFNVNTSNASEHAYKEIFEWIVSHHVRMTLPMFIMRDHSITIDASYGLHFFEPRYRVMMIEAMQHYPTEAMFGNPINLSKKPTFLYAFHGRVSPGTEVAIVEVERCLTHPDKRVDVILTIKEFAHIEDSWERPNSYGLYVAQVVRTW